MTEWLNWTDVFQSFAYYEGCVCVCVCVCVFMYITYNICFTFSISLLKFSLCSSSPLLSLVCFFMNVTSIILLNKLLIFILWEVFVVVLGFYLVLSFGTYFSVFSFCLAFFVVVVCLYNLGEIITSPALEGNVLSGSVPMLTMCAQWLWQEA